jgi:hypothetical protein
LVFTQLPGRSPHAAERRSVGRRNLDPIDTLQTLSEIGIAITGFAGVAAALDSRSRAEWSDFDRANLYTLLTWSISTVFLAYVPLILHGLNGLVSHPWRTSLALFAIYHSWIFFSSFRGVQEIPAFRSRQILALSVIGILVLALEVSGALGFADAFAPTVYVVAVLWFLFLAVTRFVVLVTATLFAPAAQQSVEPDVE